MELRGEWCDAVSCADKLKASLAARLPAGMPDDEARAWAEAAVAAAQTAWDGPAQVCPLAQARRKISRACEKALKGP